MAAALLFTFLQRITMTLMSTMRLHPIDSFNVRFALSIFQVVGGILTAECQYAVEKQSSWPRTCLVHERSFDDVCMSDRCAPIQHIGVKLRSYMLKSFAFELAGQKRMRYDTPVHDKAFGKFNIKLNVNEREKC
jgi:hypothetical protein